MGVAFLTLCLLSHCHSATLQAWPELALSPVDVRCVWLYRHLLDLTYEYTKEQVGKWGKKLVKLFYQFPTLGSLWIAKAIQSTHPLLRVFDASVWPTSNRGQW
jgi:hypothetical protein